MLHLVVSTMNEGVQRYTCRTCAKHIERQPWMGAGVWMDRVHNFLVLHPASAKAAAARTAE